jgi:predicted SnoaL-like aldol condensation-catalyzing enzyme
VGRAHEWEEGTFFFIFIREKKNRNPGMIATSRPRHLSRGDLVLLYDNKYLKHPGRLQMHWVGPFKVVDIREFDVVHMLNLMVFSVRDG